MTTKDPGEEVNLVLHDKTGALLMLNKEERKLLKELLVMTLNSEPIRSYIVKRLGNRSIEIAENLIKSMGGS